MLRVQSVSFAYDEAHPVLDQVSLTLNTGDILCILGASGSGKTTLLRIIAGLEKHYTGEVLLNGDNLTNRVPHERGFGLMFQDFALFPHMNVAENVGFGLRMQGQSRQQRQQTVDELLDLVGLGGYQERDIASLSGGQQQRVALARSLAPQPQLLLLDEPLGALDAGLKDRLLADLRAIIKDRHLSAIYVTHDQQEAFTIADHIAVMHQGNIVQADEPRTLYQHPVSVFVARFLGLENIVSGQWLNAHNMPISDADATYLLHPDGISLNAAEADTLSLQATLVDFAFLGNHYRLRVRADDGQTLTFTVPARNFNADIGMTIEIIIASDMVQALVSS